MSDIAIDDDYDDDIVDEDDDVDDDDLILFLSGEDLVPEPSIQVQEDPEAAARRHPGQRAIQQSHIIAWIPGRHGTEQHTPTVGYPGTEPERADDDQPAPDRRHDATRAGLAP